jgi:hypothetical protein
MVKLNYNSKGAANRNVGLKKGQAKGCALKKNSKRVS